MIFEPTKNGLETNFEANIHRSLAGSSSLEIISRRAGKSYNCMTPKVPDIQFIYGGHMRTISVKEAAQILDLTPRAVTYRLDKGQLKGSLLKNDAGTPEWRIQVNAEILDALKRKGLGETRNEREINFAPQESVEIIDADPVTTAQAQDITEVEGQSLQSEVIKTVAEQMIRPLVERLEAQTAALMEKDKIIAEQATQLRLLPDLQRQAEVEKQEAAKEREAVQLVAHERDALKKQVAALELDKDVAEEERRLAEQEKTKAEEALKEVALLKETVAKLQQPFWKKLFGGLQ